MSLQAMISGVDVPVLSTSQHTRSQCLNSRFKANAIQWDWCTRSTDKIAQCNAPTTALCMPSVTLNNCVESAFVNFIPTSICQMSNSHSEMTLKVFKTRHISCHAFLNRSWCIICMHREWVPLWGYKPPLGDAHWVHVFLRSVCAQVMKKVFGVSQCRYTLHVIAECIPRFWIK